MISPNSINLSSTLGLGHHHLFMPLNVHDRPEHSETLQLEATYEQSTYHGSILVPVLL